MFTRIKEKEKCQKFSGHGTGFDYQLEIKLVINSC